MRGALSIQLMATAAATRTKVLPIGTATVSASVAQGAPFQICSDAVLAVRLTFVSGYVTCGGFAGTNWGCENHGLGMFISNSSTPRAGLVAPAHSVTGCDHYRLSSCNTNTQFYRLDGMTGLAPSDYAPLYAGILDLPVTSEQPIRMCGTYYMWYSEGYYDSSLRDNRGEVTFDIALVTADDDGAIIELTGESPKLAFGDPDAPTCELRLDRTNSRLESTCPIAVYGGPHEHRHLAAGPDWNAKPEAELAELKASNAKLEAELAELKASIADIRRALTEATGARAG